MVGSRVWSARQRSKTFTPVYFNVPWSKAGEGLRDIANWVRVQNKIAVAAYREKGWRFRLRADASPIVAGIFPGIALEDRRMASDLDAMMEAGIEQIWQLWRWRDPRDGRAVPFWLRVWQDGRIVTREITRHVNINGVTQSLELWPGARDVMLPRGTSRRGGKRILRVIGPTNVYFEGKYGDVYFALAEPSIQVSRNMRQVQRPRAWAYALRRNDAEIPLPILVRLMLAMTGAPVLVDEAFDSNDVLGQGNVLKRDEDTVIIPLWYSKPRVKLLD